MQPKKSQETRLFNEDLCDAEETRRCENCGKFGGYRADHFGKKVMCGGQYKDTLLARMQCAGWVPQNMKEVDGYYFSTIELVEGKVSAADLATSFDSEKDTERWEKFVKEFGTPVEDFLPNAKNGVEAWAEYEADRLKALKEREIIDEQPSVEAEPETMSCGVDPVTTEPSPAFQAFQEMGKLETRIAALEAETERVKQILPSWASSDIIKPTETTPLTYDELLEDVKRIEWHARNLHYKAPEQLGDVHSIVDFFWKKLQDLLKKYKEDK